MSEPTTYASDTDALAALRAEFPGSLLELRVQLDTGDGPEARLGDPDRTVAVYEVVGLPKGAAATFVRRSTVQGATTWTIVRS